MDVKELQKKNIDKKHQSNQEVEKGPEAKILP